MRPLSAAFAGLQRLRTGIDEVDEVLGGGFVRGAAVLLAGEPGIGKSTLVLQLIDALVASGHSCLLATGEESLDQVALRGGRLGVGLEPVRAAASCSLAAVLSGAAAEAPDVLIVDSIQTLEDEALDQAAGSTVQVRECAARLVRFAKSSGTVVVMVGHVTKEGNVAGPKTLEHMVDAVLTLEGERHGAVRVLRSSKNRFGSCDATGVFVMRQSGLEPVEDASAMLLADRRADVSGSVVFPSLEGTRPFLVELQSLVTPSGLAQPRRVALGVDARRLALLLGVLARRVHLPLGSHDVFVAAAGGLAVREPAADLALCLSVASAAADRPIDERVVAIGEVGLSGEIRRVAGAERRLAEAARLGFRRAVVPGRVEEAPQEIELLAVETLRDALAVTLEADAALRVVG